MVTDWEDDDMPGEMGVVGLGFLRLIIAAFLWRSEPLKRQATYYFELQIYAALILSFIT